MGSLSLCRSATIALLGILAGCAASEPIGRNPTIPSAASSSELRPGDSLTIAIIGVPDPTTNSVQIDDQGIVSLPYIGAIKASGETTAGLTQSIREAYVTKKIYLSVDISVSVTERYVYVGGEVEKPGRIIWTPDLTAAKAIQAAGGFTLYAKQERVGVVRNQVLYLLDIKLAQTNPSQDPRLDPGDSIQVSRSAF
jgi:protein involved in polysaccharide export with SLBB domain